MKKLFTSAFCLTLLGLCACSSDDTAPPTLSITSPAANAPVSGTATVQVSATDDEGVTRVDLYAKDKGSDAKGVLVGSASEEPFVISWYTPAQPNFAEVDLVAIGSDAGGNESSSPAVTVKTQNSGVPSLQLLTAFTLEPDPTIEATSATPNLPSSINVEGALAPIDGVVPTLENNDLIPQQAPVRDYILEWQWEPFAGADGYGVYLSEDALVGPYESQRKQSGSAGSGVQKFSAPQADVGVGDSLHGVVTAITDGATVESGFSNGDVATFLGPQEAISPEDNAEVSGRPTFAWKNTPGTVGYLYYVFDSNPWEANATQLWSNFPQSTSALNTTYDREPLPAGTYWWWVAGISFDTNGKADGFTFSEARSFTVK